MNRQTQVTHSTTRPPLRLVKTIGMSREAWLDVRRTGIGSSDAAAAVGVSPYQSPLELWMVKTGRTERLEQPDSDDDTSPVYWGHLLEPIVARAYERRSGNKVRRVNAVLQHPNPDYPWMLANIDREVIGQPEVQILECKTTGAFAAKLWDHGVPEHVQVQVQHQLAVTGKAAADVAVLIAGQTLRIHRIERDEGLITDLIQLEKHFWRFVETDTPPPADGSDSSDRALHALFPHDHGESQDWRDDTTWSARFDDLLALRQQRQALEAQEQALMQTIKQAMGDATTAAFTQGKISWKRSQDSQVLDTARLKKEHPDLMAQYQTTREGSRRFLISTKTQEIPS
ncbi:MAG TPA: YqaJ viral recombinase family protein [Halothiobacillus sp.]|jgi:putative phage-type endonuclease|nr:YqaJ viral recombinase family protein [Halothiobacillus sp.]HQT43049.1 YqaJ viral recombinase family protein [Halothiobacillus sp.]